RRLFAGRRDPRLLARRVPTLPTRSDSSPRNVARDRELLLQRAVVHLFQSRADAPRHAAGEADIPAHQQAPRAYLQRRGFDIALQYGIAAVRHEVWIEERGPE